METVLCNYCSSSSSDLLYRIPDFYLDKKDIFYSLVKCRNCGLIFQNPRPTQKEIGEAYPNTYEAFYLDQDRTWLETKVFQYGLEKRCKTITSIKRNRGRLLDIGCSTGLFLNAMQFNHGWESFGVEVSEYPASIAREKYHLNIFQGSLEQTSYPPSFFDAVTLWDVLEHLPDPSSTLQEVKRIIKPDGVLVIRVPNYDSWDAKIFGSVWAGLDVPRHFYVFSQKNLLKLLEKNGFTAPKLSCKIGSFSMFVISLRFWMNKKSINSSRQRTITGLINQPITQIIFTPFFLISRLFLRGPVLTSTAFPRTQ
ncbi:MAG: class I SAM-dependent methyltransferase [Anaerolineales bacterium]